MKIRCIANTGASLPDDYIEPAIGYTKQIQFSLTVGREYVVYAFREWRGTIWYYICDDNYTYYPMQNPAPLFEVVDSRVSKYWRFELAPNGRLEIAFEQWFTDPYFYDKLTDQEEAEVEIFDQVKELMDAEDFDLPPLDVAVDKLRETVSV
ncbi:hypothetical protein C7B67_22620 [filamentous cyanobacterium Phorm 6]|nr:hypothetical protein C7B67_22620 [filamentous cyanobacterium Phorm 6]